MVLHISPCDKMKEVLLASHKLTNFQRVELLLAMELLHGRPPAVRSPSRDPLPAEASKVYRRAEEFRSVKFFVYTERKQAG